MKGAPGSPSATEVATDKGSSDNRAAVSFFVILDVTVSAVTVLVLIILWSVITRVQLPCVRSENIDPLLLLVPEPTPALIGCFHFTVVMDLFCSFRLDATTSQYQL